MAERAGRIVAARSSGLATRVAGSGVRDGERWDSESEEDDGDAGDLHARIGGTGPIRDSPSGYDDRA
jgi:hypothetical protein